MIRNMITKMLMLWLAGLAFAIFLCLYLSGGELMLYEDIASIRLAELIIYSGILGYTIYECVRYYRRGS